MTFKQRFDKALSSQAPIKALRSLVLELSAEGRDKKKILKIFEEQRKRLRLANRESAEDAVMDVMDFLVGWCSPHVKLLSDESGTRNRAVQITTPLIQEPVL